MPPKKKEQKKAKKTPEQLKKEKQEKQLFEYNNQQTLLREKLEKETAEHFLSRALLTATTKLCDNIIREKERQSHEEFVKTEWHNFLYTDNLPKSNDAPGLRNYLYHCDYNDLHDETSYHSWTIHCDERSILSQDPDRIDNTREHLRSQIPDIGISFSQRLNIIINLLKKIDYYLQRQSLSDPDYLLSELYKIQSEYRNYIITYVNAFTFNIISNIERDMEPLDAHMAEYTFKDELYHIHIWCPRDVPQIPRTERLNVSLSNISISLELPVHISIDRKAIQGFWLNYDYFTTLSSSHSIPNEEEFVPDLKTAIVLEYEEKEKLRKNKLEEMLNARIEYENMIKEKAGSASAVKQSKNKQDGAKSKKKRNKSEIMEPMICFPNTIVDIDNIYMQNEDEKLSLRYELMSPNSLNLCEGEVNMREYSILGGLFFVNYVKRPYNPTYYINQSQYGIKELPLELVSENFCKVYQKPKKIDPEELEKLDRKTIEAIRKAEAEAEIEALEELLKIELEVPKTVCWWIPPKLVRWEPWEESEEFSNLHPALQDFNLNYEKHKAINEQKLWSKAKKKDQTLTDIYIDFNLLGKPREFPVYYLTVDHIIPRLPKNYMFPVEIIEEKLQQEIAYKKQRQIEEAEKLERFEKKSAAIDKALIAAKERATKRVLLERKRERKKAIDDENMENDEANEIADTENDTAVVTNNETYNEETPEIEDDHIETDEIDIDSVSISESLQQIINEAIIEEQVLAIDEIEREDEELKLHIVRSPYSENDRNNFIYRPPMHLFPSPDNFPPIKVLKFSMKHLSFENVLNREDKNRRLLLSDLLNNLDDLRDAEQGKFRSISDIQHSIEHQVERLETEHHKHHHLKSIRKSRNKSHNKKSSKDLNTATISQEVKPPKIVLKLIPHSAGRWMTTDIPVQFQDETTEKLTAYCQRFGIFGLMMPKYCCFPLKYWSLEPNTERQNEVTFTVKNTYFTCFIIISADGYKVQWGYPKLKQIEDMFGKSDPMSYKDLNEKLCAVGVNLFPATDAVCYINDISEKHRPMEEHTYFCMGTFCLTYCFAMCHFNKACPRRIALMKYKELIVGEETTYVDVKITPTEVVQGRATEACTPLDIVQIDFELIPPVQEYVPDLRYFLMSKNTQFGSEDKTEVNHILIYNVVKLLQKIRPLSFS